MRLSGNQPNAVVRGNSVTLACRPSVSRVSRSQTDAAWPSMRAFVSASNDPPGSACSSHSTTRPPPADAARAAARPAGPGTYHQHVAMRIVVQIAIRIGCGRRPPQTRSSTNSGLVDMSPECARPHEGLVVKACGNQWRDRVIDRADVEGQRGEAVLTACPHALMQFNLGRPKIRRDATGASIDRHQCVGFLRSSGQNTARPMIFERAADQVHAVRQQCRCERVAKTAGVSSAVEAESERACAIHPATVGSAERTCHCGGDSLGL